MYIFDLILIFIMDLDDEGMPPAGGASQTDEPSWLHNINDIFIYISIVIDISRLARERAVQGSARFASRFGSCPVLSCPVLSCPVLCPSPSHFF